MTRLQYHASRRAYGQAVRLDRATNEAMHRAAIDPMRDRPGQWWPTSARQQAVLASLPVRIAELLRYRGIVADLRSRNLIARSNRTLALYAKRFAAREAVAIARSFRVTPPVSPSPPTPEFQQQGAAGVGFFSHQKDLAA